MVDFDICLGRVGPVFVRDLAPPGRVGTAPVVATSVVEHGSEDPGSGEFAQSQLELTERALLEQGVVVDQEHCFDLGILECFPDPPIDRFGETEIGVILD